MSGVEKRTFLLLLFLLASGKLNVKPQIAVNRTVHYTICGSDCQNKYESLETIAVNCTEGQDVYVDIKVPHLNLNNSIRFCGLHSLTINGNPNSATVINCIQQNNGAGIGFENVSNLTLTNLTLTYCGSLLQLESRNKTYTYSSALTMLHCIDVYISNLIVTRSQGIGLTVLHHQKGKVYIVASNFTENRIKNESIKDRHQILGGGGVYVGELRGVSHSQVSFQFKQCIFANNTAHTRYYDSFYTNEYGVARSGYGRGGGVFLALEKKMRYTTVSISFISCTFSKNLAFHGGGLSVSIGRTTKFFLKTAIIIFVKDSVFDSNGCSNSKNTSIGGGAQLCYNSINKCGGMYIFQNVTFTKNCAEVGGGVHFYTDRQNSSNRSLLFDRCTFQRNKAHIGSAIDLTPNIFMRLSIGHTSIIPVFINCTFMNNMVFVNSESHDSQRIAGIGTLYSSLYDIRFNGKNHFENNRGTPVYIVNGIADFSQSSVTFKNNEGVRGGAIALLGTSSMILGPDKSYMFINNKALYQGGAIFALLIDTHEFTVSKSCFIQIYHNGKYTSAFAEPWKNSITFFGNTAPFGNAIFTTSLHACKNDTSESYFNVSKGDILTEGAHLFREYDRLYVIPGKKFSHGVIIKDDQNNTVNEPLKIRMNFTGVMVDPAYSSFAGKMLQLRGTPGMRAKVYLQTVSTRESYTRLEVELGECPPGFELEKDRCVCNTNEYLGLTDYCDSDNFQTYLTPGLWAGLISENEIATGMCPYSFCDYTQSTENNTIRVLGIALPKNRFHLDEVVCGATRTGILCGRCRKGYTVHFHSPRFLCNQTDLILCKAGWLFYILSELLPVTVVFITVILFNISFTSGAVNGFILFSQVLLSFNVNVVISGDVKLPFQRAITEGYQFLYGFLNLDFFTTETLSFCLWPSATALDMLVFKYITILYALSLVVSAIWFMNKCGGRCLGKWCRITKVKSSVIHGISAFLIMCYSQTIAVSHSLLNGTELWLREGSNVTILKRVWLDGNITFLSRRHLPYALPALLFLLTIGIFPPILLLAFPLSNKALTFFGIEESKLVIWVSQKLPMSNLKPLLDCFQSCFKDNFRFFAGLYFLYRWIAPVVYTTSSSLSTAYITTEILLILTLAIHALCQPYIKRVYNMIDTVLLTDLLLINSITCIHYYLFQSRENQHTVNKKVARIAIIQAILIYLPFITMLACMLLFGLRQMYNTYYKKYGNKSSRNITLSNSFMKLRARVNSKELLNDNESDFNEQELDDASYNRFEDSDDKLDMY